MKIIGLAPEHEEEYCLCLEEWSSEIRGSGDHQREWLDRHRGSGLRVRLAVDEKSVAGGAYRRAGTMM